MKSLITQQGNIILFLSRSWQKSHECHMSSVSPQTIHVHHWSVWEQLRRANPHVFLEAASLSLVIHGVSWRCQQTCSPAEEALCSGICLVRRPFPRLHYIWTSLSSGRSTQDRHMARSRCYNTTAGTVSNFCNWHSESDWILSPLHIFVGPAAVSVQGHGESSTLQRANLNVVGSNLWVLRSSEQSRHELSRWNKHLWDGTHQNVGFTFRWGFVKRQRQTVEICETEAKKETIKSILK